MIIYGLREDYAKALEKFEKAANAVAEYRRSLANHETTMEDLEAEVIANGGWGEMAITGSNAEQRKAQVAVILAAIPEYREAKGMQITDNHRYQQHEAAKAVAIEQMRYCRVLIEYETARLYEEAAKDKAK